MKVIGIVGSPRKNGNTNILVQQVLEGAAEAGAETRTFILNEMNYKGCQGCEYCKNHDKCNLEDDLTEVFDELASADGIVLGSPIYFGQFTGQMRLFLDRCYSLINADFSPRLPAGKKAVVIETQGDLNPETFKNVYEEFAGQISGVMHAEVKDILVGVGYRLPGEVKDNIELMEKAKNAGLNLLK